MTTKCKMCFENDSTEKKTYETCEIEIYDYLAVIYKCQVSDSLDDFIVVIVGNI